MREGKADTGLQWQTGAEDGSHAALEANAWFPREPWGGFVLGSDLL